MWQQVAISVDASMGVARIHVNGTLKASLYRANNIDGGFSLSDFKLYLFAVLERNPKQTHCNRIFAHPPMYLQVPRGC